MFGKGRRADRASRSATDDDRVEGGVRAMVCLPAGEPCLPAHRIGPDGACRRRRWHDETGIGETAVGLPPSVESQLPASNSR